MKRALVLMAVLVVAGCGSADASGPPEINYGRDLCIECGMVIDDDRFAAAYRLEDGTEKTFDDLGGLIIHGRATGELASAAVWVHDFDTREWLQAPDAFYVPTLGVTSPMGHGILAFSDEQAAAQTAHDLGGEVIAWATVLELPVMASLLGHHHMEDMEGMDDMDHEHETSDG